jgi:hypothetical protein
VTSYVTLKNIWCDMELKGSSLSATMSWVKLEVIEVTCNVHMRGNFPSC